MLAIKKKFTLNINSIDTVKLNKLTTEVQVNTMLLDVAKKDLVCTLTERNSVIKTLLLQQFEYILHPTDQVMYNDQLGEICIYEGPEIMPTPRYEE